MHMVRVMYGRRKKCNDNATSCKVNHKNFQLKHNVLLNIQNKASKHKNLQKVTPLMLFNKLLPTFDLLYLHVKENNIQAPFELR